MNFRLPVFILSTWGIIALLTPQLALQPNEIHLDQILVGPGMSVLLGYDDLGRWISHRLLSGARTSFLVAAWVVTLSAVVGTTIGTFSAYIGGKTDRLIVQVIDIFLAFPGILLAIALAGLLGPGIDNVVIALTIVGWVGFARLSRAQTLSVKHREHIVAAHALGIKTPQILLRHLLPLISAPLLIETTFGIASVVVAEAGLSFLGLGVQAPDASWGNMIRDGTRYLLIAPHMVMAPGLALLLVVLSVNLAGDHLRDQLDVRLRTVSTK